MNIEMEVLHILGLMLSYRTQLAFSLKNISTWTSHI